MKLELFQWLGGIGFLGFLGTLFGLQTRKMDKLVPKDLCKSKCSEVDRRLNRGESKFDCMDKKLDEIKEVVIRIDTKLECMENE